MTTSTLPASPASSRVTVLICFAMGVLEGFDIQVIGIAAPRMGPALGLGPAGMTLVFFASNLGLLIGASAGGWLADRHGRRPVIIGSAIMFGAFTLATGLSTELPGLLSARLLAGLGLGAALPNMVAVAAEVSRPERLGQTTALMFCGIPLGGALVALVSRGVGGLDWRMLFVIGGVLPLILAVVQWRYLRETRSAALPTMVAVPVVRALFGDGRWAVTLLLWLTVAPTLMAVYLVLYWLPTLLTQNGFSPSLAADAAAAFNLSGVVGAVAIGWLVDRLGVRIVCGGGYLAVAVVAVLLSRATDGTSLLILSGAAGFLLLGLNYAVYGIAGACYPGVFKATGTGAAMSAGRLGSILGPTLSGALIVAGVGPGGILLMLAPIAVAAGLSVVALQAARGSAPR